MSDIIEFPLQRRQREALQAGLVDVAKAAGQQLLVIQILADLLEQTHRTQAAVAAYQAELDE